MLSERDGLGNGNACLRTQRAERVWRGTLQQNKLMVRLTDLHLGANKILIFSHFHVPSCKIYKCGRIFFFFCGSCWKSIEC